MLIDAIVKNRAIIIFIKLKAILDCTCKCDICNITYMILRIDIFILLIFKVSNSSIK